ncbi:Uncharacterised protein [Legionella spiritensis]|nr:Uncharacterised protein [Legionella spiritensis]
MRDNVPDWHIKPAIRPQASLRATAFSQKNGAKKNWCTETRLCEQKFSQLQIRLIGAIMSLNSLNRARYSPHSKT